MANLGVMMADIRREMRRSTMDTQIKSAIIAAVDYWKDKRFRWNESTFTFSLASAQYEYSSTDSASIGYLTEIDDLKLSVSNEEWHPDKRTIAYVAGLYDANISGDPSDYAFYRARIRFYPIPSRTLTATVLGVMELLDTNQSSSFQRLSRTISDIASVPDSYTTAWFTDGYELIKSHAKGYLYKNMLRNDQEGDKLLTDAMGIGGDFQKKIGRMGGASFVTPTQF